MPRLVSTRFITGIYRTRDMYNWTTFDDACDAAEQVVETEIARKRRLTAERVRRHREKMKKNLAATALQH